MTTNGSFTQDRRGSNLARMRPYESKELIDTLQRIVQQAGTLLGAHYCSIFLLDRSGTSLVTMAALPDTTQKVPDAVCAVVDWVLKHHEMLLLNDISVDVRFQHLDPVPAGSVLCIPLLDDGRCIGTLAASSARINMFDTQKVHTLSILTGQAELAILNARQTELAQNQARQLEALMHLAQSITASLEPAQLYRTILSKVRHLLACERATILLYYPDSQTLSVVAEWLRETESELIFVDDPDAHQKRDHISIHDKTSLAAWAAVHMHLMLSGSTPQQWSETRANESDAVPHELAMPLASKELLYGVLSLERREEPFSSDELRLIRNLGSLIAIALEQSALFHRMRGDQEQLRAIWSANSDGVALLGDDGCVIEANESFAHIFALDANQVVGTSYLQLLAYGAQSDPPTEARQTIQQALDQKKPLAYIELAVPLQGAMRTIGLSLTPISTPHAPLSLMIVRDVTAIHEVARAKAKFLSLVTHELRSPLNTINGYLDLTLNNIAGEINEQQREFLQRARAGSEHLYALLEDLLLIARADAGHLVLNRQVLRLDDIVENAVEELNLMAVDGKVEVEIEVPQELTRIYADAVRIQQLLRNLLSNALRFTPEGGQVLISVQIIDRPAKNLAKDPDNDPDNDPNEDFDTEGRVVQLQVRDSGPGMAPEFLERIFERFYQIPLSQGGRSGGQGLGLAVAKMVAELHGGSVHVESAPGQGSIFTCILPFLIS
jgi:PAS domain S-box-containing protein